jgi:sulfur carrier protein
MTSIQINGERREVALPLTITQLLVDLGIPSETALVECNREVIQRSHFDTKSLEDGDIIELVRFVGGG